MRRLAIHSLPKYVDLKFNFKTFSFDFYIYLIKMFMPLLNRRKIKENYLSKYYYKNGKYKIVVNLK